MVSVIYATGELTLLLIMIHKVRTFSFHFLANAFTYAMFSTVVHLNTHTAHFRFVSLQSKVGQSLLVRAGRQPNDLSSIGLTQADGQSYFQTDAVLRICRNLKGHPLFAVVGYAGFLVPPPIRDGIYKVVSKNRHRFGEQYDQCRIDFDGEFDTRFVPEPEDL